MFAAQPIVVPAAREASPGLQSLFTPGPRVAAGMPLRMGVDGAAAVYRIESGWCARTRLLPDGRAQIVELLMAGDLIGLDGLAGGEPRDSVEALSDVRLGRCDLRVFEDALGSSDGLALAVARHLLVKQEEMRGWLAVLGQGDARARMAHLLLHAVERGGEGALLALPMTQQRLGELLGLTSVHVNRTVRMLREAGLATVTRGRAHITDRAGLERIARGYRGEPALAA